MTGTGSQPLSLDPALRPEDYRAVFQRFGRLHIPGILQTASAERVARTIAGASGWRRSIHVDVDHDLDIPVDELDEMDATERAEFERTIVEGGRDELQYVFDTIRITNELAEGRPVHPDLAAVAEFMNGEGFLGFVRRLTGDDRPAFCDAMATRFLPGHFLTAHGDHNPAQQRLYAYVLSLSRPWRADWGGILLFLDEDDHVAEGYSPTFNALNIFRVPQQHAVSMVSHLALEPRLSITGWIHGAPQA